MSLIINIHIFTISLRRQKEAVICLIEYGSAASTESNNKSTPLDIAKSLGFEEIADILASKASRDQDPSVPKFRDWLHYLGAVRFQHSLSLSLSLVYTNTLSLSLFLFVLFLNAMAIYSSFSFSTYYRGSTWRVFYGQATTCRLLLSRV